MSIDLITKFIAETPYDPASAWDYEEVRNLASKTVPDAFFGDQQALLKGDQHRLWLRWFVEGIVSPHPVAGDGALGRLDIFEAVFQRVSSLYAGAEIDRRRDLTERVTDHIFAEVERVRQGRARDYAAASTRLELITSQTPARCYICGFAFSAEAHDAFLKVKGRDPVTLPKLIDVFRPRGLVERDLKIEIEHVVPVAGGGKGQGNLRLACGWCNKHKSARVSLYEVPFMAPRSKPIKVGAVRVNELPSPFWMIRILALRGKCQFIDGCLRTARDDELFITFTDWGGSPNPTNLSVFCSEHDPIKVDRMQAREAVEEIWRERRR